MMFWKMLKIPDTTWNFRMLMVLNPSIAGPISIVRMAHGVMVLKYAMITDTVDPVPIKIVMMMIRAHMMNALMIMNIRRGASMDPVTVSIAAMCLSLDANVVNAIQI